MPGVSGCVNLNCAYYSDGFACGSCKYNPANMRKPKEIDEKDNLLKLCLDLKNRHGEIISNQTIFKLSGLDLDKSNAKNPVKKKRTNPRMDMDFEDF